MENCKSVDLKYAYDRQSIVIFNLTRSMQEHFNYEAMEAIKNGIFFRSKYASTQKVYPIPYVVVFANWPPDEAKLSADRNAYLITGLQIQFCQVQPTGRDHWRLCASSVGVRFSDADHFEMR